MHEQLSSDQLISHHRARPDYTESPHNTIQFAYSDHRYAKMTYELLREDDALKLKTLRQLIEDFSLYISLHSVQKTSP